MKKSSLNPGQKSTKRPLGLFRGEIWTAPDFDAPMELIESAKLSLLEAEVSRGRKKKAKPRGPAKMKSRRR
jgi:hypothetical protein